MNILKFKYLIVLKGITSKNKMKKQQNWKKKSHKQSQKYLNQIKIKQQKKPFARLVVIITNK